jgi:uncharacterized protein YkwD
MRTISLGMIAMVVAASGFGLSAGCSSAGTQGFGDWQSGSASEGGSPPSSGDDGGGASSSSGGNTSGSADAAGSTGSNGAIGAQGGATASIDAGTVSAPSGPDASSAVPDAAAITGDAAVSADGFDQFQHHNLDVVNMYRAMKSVAPLVLDAKLSTFALAGSQELSQDHTAHQHFITASNNMTIWSSGFTSQAGENQGDPNGWRVVSQDPTTNEMTQIDQIQQAMFNEGPSGGHYQNIMNAQFTRVGVGLLEVSGKLYLTNDFSN